jgi:phosphoribosylaminoimidazolecarboxamide formyltransferase / IMP cyclohydrolase
MHPIKRALISVSDKTGITEFARSLSDMGVEILSTGGTARLLKEHKIPVTMVSDYTGFPEIMDGRVKTLHPRVHGGILAKRDNQEHKQAMDANGIKSIDLVAINLYPFEQTVCKEDCTLEDAIENIDIGGPAMVRASSKNFAYVTILVNPDDYKIVLEEMKSNDNKVSFETRKRLSRDAFSHTARYDGLIAEYLSEQLVDKSKFTPKFQKTYELFQNLRYGENPHQEASFYREVEARESDIVSAKQLQGKELSFNNIVDIEAAWRLVTDFEDGAVAIIKHTNPCGAACGDNQLETFIKARETDATSAFGGILGFNRSVTEDVAKEILKNFVEAVIAPGFEPKALEIFASKKNIRVMKLPLPSKDEPSRLDIKKVTGGVLLQDEDSINLDPEKIKVAGEVKPTDAQMKDLEFAWTVAKHVKSNAIIYVKNLETVGIGAGQMSRVDSARLAVEKANKPVEGCVMASDAFFPFRDSIDTAAKAGISAIIQPGGSIRDEEVVQAANENKIPMVFTGIRHFKH